MKVIAFLGIGAMGDRIANNLLDAGYNLRVWNRTPEKCQNLVKKGAKSYSSPKEAVANADLAISMVTNDDASKFVWLDPQSGAIHGLKSEAIAIEYSTLTPDWCRELETYIIDKGCNFLGAPVIGTLPQAENASLVHLVGGREAILDRVRDVLKVNSVSTYYLGAVGQGMTMKLAVNALFGAQVVALSEILGVLQNAGIATESAVNLLNNLPTTSPTLKAIGSLIAANKYDPLFPIDLVEKDFAYLEKLANSFQSSIPAIAKVRKIYQQGKAAGYGQDNITGIAKLYL